MQWKGHTVTVRVSVAEAAGRCESNTVKDKLKDVPTGAFTVSTPHPASYKSVVVCTLIVGMTSMPSTSYFSSKA